MKAENMSAQGSFPSIAWILRTVQEEDKAFYFYKGIGHYLDVRARSLEEFAEKLRFIDRASIAFHASRWDFANWLSTTIGDATLARLVSNLCSGKNQEDIDKLRTKLVEVVKSRVTRLRRFQSE